jgi:hypothetical protein
MELLRGAVELELKERKAKKAAKKKDEDVTIISDRDPVESWRRVGIRVLWVVQAARTQAVLLELKTLPPPTYPIDEMDSDENVTGKNLGITRAQLLARQRLSDSKSLKTQRPTTECSHRYVAARGGARGARWFSCKTYPMRWQRNDGEYLLTPDGALEKTSTWKPSSSSPAPSKRC